MWTLCGRFVDVFFVSCRGEGLVFNRGKTRRQLARATSKWGGGEGAKPGFSSGVFRVLDVTLRWPERRDSETATRI